jgi:hypothetical protein
MMLYQSYESTPEIKSINEQKQLTMSTKTATAVLHCTVQQPEKVIERGIKVRDGVYKNTTLYTTPPIAKAVFVAQLNAAITAQGNVKGGGKNATMKRDGIVSELYGMLDHKLLLYVNSLYRGNKDNLAASGFDVVFESTPHEVPAPPVIKDIINAAPSHSAKILLAKTTSPLNTKTESFEYIVQMAEDDSSEENFKQVLLASSQFKLIITGLQRGKEVFFRIAKRNRRGQSGWSDSFPFMPS